MKKIIIIFVIAVLCFWGGSEITFQNKKMKSFSFGDKNWIHRRNSIEELEQSLKEGYKGIECDVFYIVSEDRFYISHDWPLQTKVDLEDYLKLLRGTDVKLWLDFKNASLGNISSLVHKLKELESKYSFTDRYFIEAQDLTHQVVLSWYGINSVLWLSHHTKSRISFLRNFLNRLAVTSGDFIAVSFAMNTYQNQEIETYSHIDKLLFTAEKRSEIVAFEKDPKIRIILRERELKP